MVRKAEMFSNGKSLAFTVNASLACQQPPTFNILYIKTQSTCIGLIFFPNLKVIQPQQN